jgi:hypothetical protein
VNVLGITLCIVVLVVGVFLPQLLLLRWFIRRTDALPEPQRTHMYNLYMIAQSTDDPLTRDMLIKGYMDAHSSDWKEEKR